ncbi:MAG: MBL fold metallo-hydrolase [Chloroflexota bacterium]
MSGGLRVRFLGSGGALNECRHQACLLVEPLDGTGGPILFDTGNGLDIIRQMLAANLDPHHVKDIFVSHQHADHVGGLDPFLLWTAVQTIRANGGPPEYETRVYAEPRILDCIDRLFDATATTAFKLHNGQVRMIPLRDGATIDLAIGGRLTAFLVDHEPVGGGAMGCVLEMAGRRIAYSGDTRPSERLVDLCRGVDALFHEAGGLDERRDYMHRVGHSTAGDAGRAARAAGAGQLILTHLPDLGMTEAMLEEARRAFGGPVTMAADLESIEV